jgi:nucleotide-binding universal stress UspA family protein
LSVTARNPEPRAAIFERVVCGIDGSEEALESLTQVERLRPASGSLHLVSVAELNLAVHGGLAAPHLLEVIESDARNALADAQSRSNSTDSHLIEGSPAQGLLQEIERTGATLVALGDHGSSRAIGLLLGTTATTLLHEAPCSVLLARARADASAFPSSIVVGVDGSTRARLAYDAARELGDRLGVPLRVVAATGGKPVHAEGLRTVSGLEWDDRAPLDALVDASASTDLLVVGSRGLHGLAALGSVSERLAHRAACSVLVVRSEP